MEIDPAGATLEGAPAADGDALAPGMQLGKYRLEHVVGAGGMGVVWAAHDPDLDRAIAIKVLRGNADVALRTRLLREARAMAKVRHPNVLTVYEASSDDARDYIAMELVDGGDLNRWLATAPSRAQVWTSVLAAGRGLAAAHAAGLVHRDFKPHNVLRAEDGRVVVTDFGLARDVGEAEPTITEAGFPVGASDLSVSRLTATGALIGTPAYMAPEQLAGGAADARTDQFAYCVTAWQALAGKRPFPGDTLDQLRAAIEAGPAKLAAELPPGVRPVLERGLARDPAKRYPDLQQLLAALEAAGGPRPRKRWWLLAAGAMLAIALGVGRLAANRPPPVPAVCEAPERRFDATWPTAEPELARALDGYRGKWLESYRAACTRPDDSQFQARLDCLLSQRDQLDVVAAWLAAGRRHVEAGRVVPDLARCQANRPIALPVLPPDTRRAAVLAVRTQLLDAQLADPARQSADAVDRLASWGTWEPLDADIAATAGEIALRHGDLAATRDQLRRAISLADASGALMAGAQARVDLAELEVIEAADPTADALPRMLDDARAAVQRAGGDELLGARLGLIEARASVEQGDLLPAVLAGATAYDAFTKLSSPRATDALTIIMSQATPKARGSLVESVKNIEPRVATIPGLASALAIVQWRAGNVDEAHRWFDRAAVPAAAGELVRGRVVLPGGAPAAGATVVGWTGDLAGDSRRAYTDRSSFTGDVATADRDGGFELHVPAGGAIVAEAGELRSLPVAATPAPMTIALVATHTEHATIDGPDDRWFEGVARFTAGSATWRIRVATGAGAFTLDRVPTGGVLGASSEVGRASTRWVRADGNGVVTWPKGITVDVVYRPVPVLPVMTDAWVVAAPRPRSRAELEVAIRTRRVIAHAVLGPIGADAVAYSRPSYRRGDRHAVFLETDRTDVTCVSGPTARPVCTDITATPDAANFSSFFTFTPPGTTTRHESGMQP